MNEPIIKDWRETWKLNPDLPITTITTEQYHSILQRQHDQLKAFITALLNQAADSIELEKEDFEGFDSNYVVGQHQGIKDAAAHLRKLAGEGLQTKTTD